MHGQQQAAHDYKHSSPSTRPQEARHPARATLPEEGSSTPRSLTALPPPQGRGRSRNAALQSCPQPHPGRAGKPPDPRLLSRTRDNPLTARKPRAPQLLCAARSCACAASSAVGPVGPVLPIARRRGTSPLLRTRRHLPWRLPPLPVV